MRFVFTGGGSGGHVYPALAIADSLSFNVSDISVFYIGGKGIEKELVKKHNYRFFTLNVIGLKRSFSLQNIKAIILSQSAKIKALHILKKIRPDAVIATGGYVSYPVVSAANLLKIPTVIHESNALPGLTVKLLSKKPH